MPETKELLKVAEEAAREAGFYISSRVDTLKEISHKGGLNDLVTDVDKASEKMIIDRIKKSFPEHSILAEESGEEEKGGECLWVIDPLDGTTNFAHGFPFFCVSIGVAVNGTVAAGAVYEPLRDEMFTAAKGTGACLNGGRIRVSCADTVASSLIATGFAYSRKGKMSNIEYFGKILEHAQAVRRAGSAALDLCYVACGRFDGFWEMGLNPWDTAAGQLIVKEAGGTVSMLEGEEFDIHEKEILATNGRVHDEMIRSLNE